jgi:hypothetical protein
LQMNCETARAFFCLAVMIKCNEGAIGKPALALMIQT